MTPWIARRITQKIGDPDRNPRNAWTVQIRDKQQNATLEARMMPWIVRWIAQKIGDPNRYPRGPLDHANRCTNNTRFVGSWTLLRVSVRKRKSTCVILNKTVKPECTTKGQAQPMTNQCPDIARRSSTDHKSKLHPPSPLVRSRNRMRNCGVPKQQAGARWQLVEQAE